MRKVCRKCGGLTVGSPICAGCARERNRARPWYGGDWPKIRAAALRAANYLCQVCGKPGTKEDPLTVDHVIPRSLEGGVVVMHRTENSSKGGQVQ